MLPFSDDWIVFVWKNYSILISGFGPAVIGVLKIIAIFRPSVKNDKVRELIRQWTVSKKGGTK